MILLLYGLSNIILISSHSIDWNDCSASNKLCVQCDETNKTMMIVNNKNPSKKNKSESCGYTVSQISSRFYEIELQGNDTVIMNFRPKRSFNCEYGESKALDNGRTHDRYKVETPYTIRKTKRIDTDHYSYCAFSFYSTGDDLLYDLQTPVDFINSAKKYKPPFRDIKRNSFTKVNRKTSNWKSYLFPLSIIFIITGIFCLLCGIAHVSSVVRQRVKALRASQGTKKTDNSSKKDNDLIPKISTAKTVENIISQYESQPLLYDVPSQMKKPTFEDR